jgi:hypothetical protein
MAVEEVAQFSSTSYVIFTSSCAQNFMTNMPLLLGFVQTAAFETI